MAKSLSQTPAPVKDRIKGSKVNPKGSASSEKSATKIKFDAKTIIALNNKLKEFRESHSNENITLNDLKAVYRRGLGAYSSSHRPTISGGKPNSRNAWAMARVNKFLLKAGGTKVKKAYVQDDDLMKYADGGEVGQDIKCRRCGWEWNTSQSEEFDKYICHNCGFDNRTFYDVDPIGYADGGEVDDKKKTYAKWKSLVNMSYGEIKKFYDSKEGKEAGLSTSEANKQGISSGRESARMLMKMKITPKDKWTDTMWKWANKQISFISRMSGMQGKLYDDKGNKTRKHTSLLIWGHNPKKSSSMKYENGGVLIPQQGTLYTKDKKSKLEYYKKGNDYAFKVYDVENNPVQNYTRNQYKNRGKDEVLMTYNQFINYLYSELYIDDKFADGGEMDVRMEDTVQRMDNPNFADISFYKKGGELNPDDPKTKNEIVHKSGKVGGMLVGNRHSEGGIKAINKSTGQPLEMEGGEVVITRNAVSDEKKRLFEGEMLTNRQILSKINQSGGGVSFAKGGKVNNDDCGCNHYDAGGKITKDKRVISKMMKLYPQDFNKGVNEETREHGDTFKSFKQGKINLKETVKMVVAKHLQEKPNYYKNYNLGGYLTLGSLKIPSLKEFINLGYSIISPFENDDSIYMMVQDSENNDEKYYRHGDKKANKITNLLAYETYLYDNFGILFSQLPIKVKNGLTLGKQSLIDNYINS